MSQSKLLAVLLVSAVSVPAFTAPGSAESKSWWLDVEGGAEYSDNVALEQSDANSTSSDLAAVMELDAGYKFVDEKDARVEVGYNFYQSIYQDLSAFNYQSHNPSFMAWIKPGGIKLGFEYSYTHSLLDGDFFLDQHMLSPTVSAFVSDDFYLTGYYRYFDKNYNHADDARDAKTHQVGADLYYYFDRPNKGFLSFGAGFTSEDTQGAAFDYDGLMGRAAVQFPLELFARKAHLKFSYAYQKRDYDNPESLTPPVAGESRSDDRHTFKVMTDVELDDNLKAIAEVRRVSRNSNLAASDYVENVGAVSLKYSF
ncbi:MAG: hypothetical protein ABL973_15115 [Micropepsaceae bacterium]